MRRMLSWNGYVVAAGAALVLAPAACGGSSNSGSGGSASSAGGSGGTGGAAPISVSTTSGDSSLFAATTGTAGAPPTCEEGSASDDGDGDGFTENDGDCNDCDAAVNPKAIEVIAEAEPGKPAPEAQDEDCNDLVDDVLASCDDKLAIDSQDPLDGARAIGLCKFVTAAKWVLADGSDPPVTPDTPPEDDPKLKAFHLGHGILRGFGAENAPREGKSFLALSSGAARGLNDPGFEHRNFDKGYTSKPPAGFDGVTPACGSGTGAPHDATGLEVEVEVPSNAQAFSFDFNFFTYEWPQFICKEFNDFFVAILSPAPEGSKDGNISFDGSGNPISVNNAFIDSCGCTGNPPGTCKAGGTGGEFKCSLGASGLKGTDFALNTDKDGLPIDENGQLDPLGTKAYTNGSTGWLATSIGVTPGQKIKLRFVSYDSADGKVDSLALVDNWKWSAKPGSKKPTTLPVPK